MTIVCVCLSPGFQRTVVTDSLQAGEVNRLQRVAVDVAGKGVNVCRVLQRLGRDALCLSPGGDNGDEIMALAESEGLNLRLVSSSGRLRTCTSIVEMKSPSGHRVTELVEPCPPVTDTCVEAMTASVAASLANACHSDRASALVIAGSAAPGFPPGYQAGLVRLANQAGVPVFVDLQGAALRDVVQGSAPSVVKINLSEFSATFLPTGYASGEHCGELAGAELRPGALAAIADASRQFDTHFILTRGPHNVLHAHHGALSSIELPPLASTEILSTIGAGDSFLGGLIAHLLDPEASPNGLAEALGTSPSPPLERAIRFAARCAQSSARTLRPGVLHDDFDPRP